MATEDTLDYRSGRRRNAPADMEMSVKAKCPSKHHNETREPSFGSSTSRVHQLRRVREVQVP